MLFCPQKLWLCMCFLVVYLGIHPSAHAESIPLDRNVDMITDVELPASNYVREDFIAINSAWRLVGMSKGLRVWETTLPIRTRSLFYHRPPSGMEVHRRSSAEAPWENSDKIAFGKRSNVENPSWNFGGNSLRISRPISDGKPESWEYSVYYPTASNRERILEDTNTTDPKAYILRQQQIGDETRHGLYIPAPSTVRYALTIPPSSKFTGAVTIVPPEASSAEKHSTGAEIIFTVIHNNKSTELHRQKVTVGRYTNIELDLAEYALQDITLQIQTDNLGDASKDYVFLADPIIYQATKNPKRVVWVFIDTLRQDHLGVYGYERETTPLLDAWSKENATVFTNARSIAPWTLPSSRTMVTGNFPEQWSVSTTLQKELAKQGWFTSFLVGNIYLSSNFEMQKDWSSHRCINWPLAEVQIQRAQEVLDTHPDRDVFLMLHFMDMHLPYTEPLAYRSLFAGNRPKALDSDSFGRPEILKAKRQAPKGLEEYVIGRYDNNLRYIDDQLVPFLRSLPPDTVVAIFSDHGEEFWDHGSFEHGHSLYDELLRVPFIVSSPTLEKGIRTDPVSLLDLVPTTTHALKLDYPSTVGVDLHDATQTTDRSLAFGRLLYGDDGWGSLYKDNKYISLGGEEMMFHISNDIKEERPLAYESHIEGRQALSKALQKDVALGFRLLLQNPKLDAKEVTVVVEIPSGVAKAWRGSDPTSIAKMDVDNTENTVVFTWHAKNRGEREGFIIPVAPALIAMQDLHAYMLIGSEKKELSPLHLDFPEYDGSATKLLKGNIGSHSVTMSYNVTAIPSDADLELDAFDDEVSEELKILGYME